MSVSARRSVAPPAESPWRRRLSRPLFGSLATASAAEDTRPIEGVWDGPLRLRARTDRRNADDQDSSALARDSGLPASASDGLACATRRRGLHEAQLKQLEIEAQFRFYALPENSRVPSGAFELTGTYDPKLGVLNLYPSQWIEQPEGYDWAGIKAVLEDDGQSLAGALEIQGCGMVVLHRAGAGAAQPDQNVEGPSRLLRRPQLEFNEELHEAQSRGVSARSGRRARKGSGDGERGACNCRARLWSRSSHGRGGAEISRAGAHERGA